MAPNKSLSTLELAELLHMSKSTLYKLIRRFSGSDYRNMEIIIAEVQKCLRLRRRRRFSG